MKYHLQNLLRLPSFVSSYFLDFERSSYSVARNHTLCDRIFSANIPPDDKRNAIVLGRMFANLGQIYGLLSESRLERDTLDALFSYGVNAKLSDTVIDTHTSCSQKNLAQYAEMYFRDQISGNELALTHIENTLELQHKSKEQGKMSDMDLWNFSLAKGYESVSALLCLVNPTPSCAEHTAMKSLGFIQIIDDAIDKERDIFEGTETPITRISHNELTKLFSLEYTTFQKTYANLSEFSETGRDNFLFYIHVCMLPGSSLVLLNKPQSALRNAYGDFRLTPKVFAHFPYKYCMARGLEYDFQSLCD